MRIPLLPLLLALSTLPACYQFQVSGHAGYAQMAADGNLGYVSGSSTASIDQDVGSAFGLGDDRPAPYVRAMLDTGVPQLAVSAFQFDEQGSGVLQSNFGGSSTLVAGAPVNSDFELLNAKLSYAFEIGLGPISISPGIAVDYFDLDLEVRDQIGITTERVRLQAPIPVGFLRAQADVDIFSAVGEVGYMAVEVDDVDGSFLDLELLLLVHPTPLLDLFVGYRRMTLEVDGLIDNDAFDTDLTISGFMVGGGVRF